MILNRIQPEMEKILRDNQNGFREGRLITSHILLLRRILYGARSNNLPAVMVFIDFRKAFDSVDRKYLVKILQANRIPQTIVDLIFLLHTDTRAQVITSDGMTDFFEIVVGVLQGDTLALYVFILVVDYCVRLVMEKYPYSGFTVTPAKNRRVKAQKIADTEFADNIALVTDTVKEADELMREVDEVVITVGLRMNESKTKYLVENIECPDQIVSVGGKSIELVEDFVYLGGRIRNTEHDLLERKRKAWLACHSLLAVWKDLKIRLFTATVESVLLYGSKPWTRTKRLTKMVDGCYTRMLRMALNIAQYATRMKNSMLYGSQPKVSSKVTQRRLTLAGHAQRHPELTLHPLILWEPGHGLTRRGRPRLTYVDNLRLDTGLTETKEIAVLMEDRECWKTLVHGALQYDPH